MGPLQWIALAGVACCWCVIAGYVHEAYRISGLGVTHTMNYQSPWLMLLWPVMLLMVVGEHIRERQEKTWDERRKHDLAERNNRR